MGLHVYLLITLVALVMFAYTAIQSKKSAIRRMQKKIKEQWGHFSEREYEQKEYDKIADYFKKISESMEDKSSIIDDITWNDLDMDTVFMAMNTTYSSAGEECLYKILRITRSEEKELKERDRLSEYFSSHKKEAEKLQEIYYSLGRTKNISITKFIDRLYELDEKSNIKHYILDAFLGVSFITLFIEPVIGIMFSLFMIILNVFVYYSRKAEIESYFVCFKYLVYMQEAAKLIIKENCDGISSYTNRLRDICK
ncbi:MAG: hypothetical protein K2M60_07295, partial [Lachnospiraceae bacterium]|nr:hypothetical protein [Lachnospiraceae bacterium]